MATVAAATPMKVGTEILRWDHGGFICLEKKSIQSLFQNKSKKKKFIQKIVTIVRFIQKWC